ncbi:sensor histidine kinase [Anaeromassilibacillus sp. An200]|uniref:sensor histidine kinase n=1 Tax=Anaeromassilibacillus sp. An200 TaxID=1965587 RepID=UPI0013A67A83|nr:sensor histidine kinase [Anaeromassilibacillus sp. An200]
MNPVFEIATTAIESVLCLSAVAEMAGKRYGGRKHFALLFGLVMGMTIVVTFFNTLASFSFVTVVVAIIYIVFTSKFLSRGHCLIRSTACMITLFFLHSFDYIIGFSTALSIADSPSIYHGYDAMMHNSTTRVIYTLINKSLQTVLFLLVRPYLHHVAVLPRRLLKTLLLIMTAAYIIMSSLIQMIVTDSLYVMQIAVIFSWVFIMIGMLSCIFIVILFSRYQEEKNKSSLSLLANQLMEKNYQGLAASQLTLSKQLHDFGNHLKTLEALTAENPKAQQYISQLLSATYKNTPRCRSGNDVIDAIVNCKAAEAEEKKIAFTFSVHLTSAIYIPSIDLCAVLSNQLDNALEASQKIAKEQERYVKVVIEQKGNFLSFHVENRTDRDPFDSTGSLPSTKTDPALVHGLGIQNITETVEKHLGTLENSYHDHVFISFAVMQNTV